MNKYPAKISLLSGALSQSLLAVVLTLTSSVQLRGQGKDPLPPDTTWTLALAGDAIITQQLRHWESDPAFMALVKPIRAADAAAINLEINLFRLLDFKGYPQAEYGGAYEIGPPEAAADLKWMGFRLMNYANNHTTDWGVEGMLETMRLLDSHNIVHAGTGMSAGDAARARYLETAKGRFALIGMATSFTPMSRASDPTPSVMGRPGVNGLRIDYVVQLAPEQMASQLKIVQALRASVGDAATAQSSLRGVPSAWALAASAGDAAGGGENRRVRFQGTNFEPGPENKVIYTVNALDQDRILKSIASAARQANHVVLFSHSHDIRGASENSGAPAHLQEFFKKCIDAGADTVVISGPHVLRGVEIYKDKPIFYSLGDFIMQNETIEPVPFDMLESFGLSPNALANDLYDARSKPDPTTGFYTAYYPSQPEPWESVVPVATFKGNKVIEIKFYPVDLGFRVPRPHQGLPRLAEGALARKILDRLAKMSEVYGTKFVIKDGIAVWQASSTMP